MGKLINEIGNRHGRLVVIAQAERGKDRHAKWLCKCDCGNERAVSGKDLRKGHTKSCGCLQRELFGKRVSELRFMDLTGQRFGRWTVISQAENGKYGHPRWLCQCDCGNRGIVYSSGLRSGNSKSCGCLARELHSLPEGEASFNAKYGSVRRNARERGYEWALTKKQVASLMSQPCYYCGIEPNQHRFGTCSEKPFIHNGLDRKNNDLGYIPSNVVPCCKNCNYAKRARTVEEFEAWIHRAHEYLAGI